MPAVACPWAPVGPLASLQQTGQPISSPFQAAPGQPCSARRPTELTEARRPAASRALLYLAFFCSGAIFEARIDLNHHHNTISAHRDPSRPHALQDAEMQAAPPPTPPTFLTRPSSLLRLLRCLPDPRLDERAQSPQQRPQPPAQRRRLLPACASSFLQFPSESPSHHNHHQN